jgi:hypothetical protein
MIETAGVAGRTLGALTAAPTRFPPALEPILHCNVNERARGQSMIKPRKTLTELELVVRTALRDGGAIVEQIAIAPAVAQTSEANWTLLHIDSERAFDPMFRELIRPIQARYDLAW